MTVTKHPSTSQGTLRASLAARHALALLGESTPTTPLPDDALITATRESAGFDLPPQKLALLRASFAHAGVEAAARRLTATQAHVILAGRTPTRAPRDANEGFTVASLDALTPEAWAETARWQIEMEGARIEPRPFSRHEGLTAWRGEHGARKVVLCAWRLKPDWPLLEDDLRRVSALAAGEPGAQVILVTTSEATVGARLAAQRLGDIRIVDRTALQASLASLATAYQRAQERSQDEAKTRAKAAVAARKKLLAALTAIEEQARAQATGKKATGRAAVRKAATQVEQAHRLAAQALMAWETLMAGWLAAFGERAARDGSLPLNAESAAYAELADRADHLKKPLLDALRAVAKTAADGDMGYQPWRLALGEELAARCTALRWRAQLNDPADWQDFAKAVDHHALQEATRSDNAANHAAARAQHARTQLIERIGAL